MYHTEWANALDQFWGDREPGARVVLMLEPLLLRQVAKLAGFDDEDSTGIEKRFLDSVKSYIDSKFHRPWHAEPFRPGTPPLFLLQVAVQVYAASKMADAADGDYTDNAYYIQLEKLVGSAGKAATFNDQGNNHQELWSVRLQEWAYHKQLKLILPHDKSGAGRHVQFPKSQSALRVADLERLPIFFEKCEFRPCSGDSALEQSKRVDRQIHEHLNDNKCFSNWARRVLKDPTKREVAVTQIKEALATWDGECVLPTAGQTGRGKAANVPSPFWISIRHSKRWVVAKLGQTVSAAKRLSESDFGSLLSGKSVDSHSVELREGFSLYKYCEEESVFRNVKYLRPGERGLIISAAATDPIWEKVLQGEGSLFTRLRQFGWEEPEDSGAFEGLPANVRILELRLKDTLPSMTEIHKFELWREFLQLPQPQLTLSGGLRVNQKERFVAGAGPTLTLGGPDYPPFIRVNGEKRLIPSRRVQLEEFSEPGKYEVVAWCPTKMCKRFSVVIPDADLPIDLPVRCWRLTEGSWPEFRSPAPTEGDGVPQPRLFGMRSFDLKMEPTRSSNVKNAQLETIRLLCGLSANVNLQYTELHPVVRTLAIQQRSHTGRFAKR